MVFLLIRSCLFTATEYHLGLLKAKLAKYRSQLLEPSKKSEKGEGFDVLKSGDARVALIGFPSVGKSTLLSTLTHTESEAASYEFTTLTCIPGVIEYKGANIQLLDLPGIIEGAAQVTIIISVPLSLRRRHFSQCIIYHFPGQGKRKAGHRSGEDSRFGSDDVGRD